VALHTLGTNANTSLTALAGWAANLLAADVAAIDQAIVDDSNFQTLLMGLSYGQQAVIATSATHSNTTLDTLVATGPAVIPLSQILVSDLVLGVGIPAGTFVVAKPTGTSVTLSQAATTSSTPTVAFVRQGYDQQSAGLGPQAGPLYIPGGRGVLIPHPGDVIAIDNTGWPILVSAASIAYSASLWHFV